jgi:predicted Zn-dependent protease
MRARPERASVAPRFFFMLLLPMCFGAAMEPEPVPPSLAQVRRIYVEPLGHTQPAEQMRDMIITAIQNSKLFLITDDEDRADAKLRGSADDKIYTEDHNTSDSIGLHANAGGSDASRNATSGGVSSSRNIGAGVTDSESSHIQERKHEAMASIRLVDDDGDVLWSTTQESAGGKFRGAMADVADKIARQLAEDARKARHPPSVDSKPDIANSSPK